MSKKSRLILALMAICILALSVVFFFFDLDISKDIASENPNVVFLLLAAIGEFPIYVGPILFGLVYGFTLDSKKSRLLAHFVGFIFTYVAFYFLTTRTLDVFINSSMNVWQLALLPIAALCIYLFLYVMFRKIDIEKLMKIRDLVLMALILTISSFVIVEVIKISWGRVRFYALSDDYSEFTNFLTINGQFNGLVSDAYKSFPSGHTNAATCLLLLSCIPARYIKNRLVKNIIFSFSCIYIFFLGLSRICVGAHYASDVLFGFTINITCTYIIYKIFQKKGWLYARSDKC